VFLTLPFIANAQTGTLGTESPEIYCTYTSDGTTVDGNDLSAGTYEVSFYVSGINNISVIELTASYDDSVTVNETPNALMTDTLSGVQSMGYIIGDGEMVFGFVSQNSDTTSCGGEDLLIASVEMTFSASCDAQNVITVQTDPNLTFIQADYNDGYDDCYSLDAVAPDYSGNVYAMTCDISPNFGNSVSGTIVVMKNNKGETNNVCAYGEYTIDVYSDSNRTDKVTSVTSSYQTNENYENVNSFNIDGLGSGTYYATISSKYAITREDITIIISGKDITNVVIPVIACDYDQDSGISSLDASVVFSASAGKFSDSDYCDLDGDGGISSLDASIVFACSAGSLSYPEIIIE
jgi:flagellar hook assembly protein FlgD